MAERDVKRKQGDDGVSTRLVIPDHRPARESDPRGEADTIGTSTRARLVEHDLHALDNAMAKHADTLLEGAFESVEDVLNDVAESGDQDPSDLGQETAAGLPPAAAAENFVAKDSHRSEPAGLISDRDHGDATDEAVDADVCQDVGGSVNNPDVGQGSSAAERVEGSVHVDKNRPAHQRGIAAQVDALGESGVDDHDVVSGNQSRAASRERSHSDGERRREALTQELNGCEEAEVATARRASLAAHIRNAARPGILGVAAALTALSIPLQLVPPSLRTLVDWLALSLIFWVPIVWALVLLLS
jgi:hypothetical protein